MATAPDTSVLTDIALQLTAGSKERRKGQPRTLAMATLVAPGRALTPLHVVAHLSADEPLTLSRLAGGTPVSAIVTAQIPEDDLAALSIISEQGLSSTEELAIVESPPSPNRWTSLIKTPALPEPRMISGAFTGIESVEDIPHLRLEPHDPPGGSAGISGAPVLVDGALAGIVARANGDGTVWYALPVTRARLQSFYGPPDQSNVPPEPAASFDANRFFHSLGESSSTALRHADGMRRWSNQKRVHMEHLIAALFLEADGPTDRLFGAHGIGSLETLRQVLTTTTEVQIPKPGEYKVEDELTELPPLSVHVQQAVANAQAAAARVGSDHVQSRDLLYGILSVPECSAVKPLLARGIRRDEVVLTDAPAEASGGTPIVGADSDAPSGVDRLGLEREIATLSALVATRDTNTPMSIGLFGHWGSGKSFFMQKMDEQIREFRDVALADPDSPYCASIVQLWFNAWHYIDKSLWASLGAEIFEGLAQALAEASAKKEGRAQLDDARTDLRIRREAAASERKRAEEKLDQTTTKLTEHDDRIRSIRTQTDREVEASLGTPALVTEVLNVAASEPDVKKALDQASRKLGGDEIRAQSQEARAQVKEILAIGSTWQFLVKSVRDGGSARWWIAAAIVAGVAVYSAPAFVPIAVSWLQTPAKRLLSALAAFSALVAPALEIARRVTNLVIQARSSLKNTIEDERRRQLAEAEKARQTVVEEHKERAEDVATSMKKVEQIDEQIAQLKPARQFIDFIRQRNQSDTYTRHFGVIARARQDFEELTRLMKLMRDAPADVQANADGIRPVERIVLYIDDLDRCPEDKVFEVLQAVHLLLAFPLFVVVVGVDPRWLLHSLRARLTAFDDQPEEEKGDEDERRRWQSTPLNYLEKIFQIPFTLRPMGDTGYERLIDELTRPRQPSAHAAAADESAGKAVPPPAPATTPAVTAATVTTETPAPEAAALARTETPPAVPADTVPAQPEPEPAVKPPPSTAVVDRAKETHQRLRLETWESGYMKLLFPLIPSPRAAKRFVNVYRLLRGVLPGEERASLIGDEQQGGYRAVLLLLAMVTGYPVEATIVIRDLLDRVEQTGGSEDWWMTLDAIRATYLKEAPSAKPKKAAPPRGNKRAEQKGQPPAPTVHDSLPDDDGDRWEELFASLDLLRKNVARDLSARKIARWAPIVARYSFASGRLLVADRRQPRQAD